MLRKLRTTAVCCLLALLVCAGAMAQGSYPIVETPITVQGLVVTTNGVGSPRLSWTALEEVTGIHVEWTAVESEALAVYMAASEWPDFFHVRLDSTYTNDYGILGGKFVDYNDYLEYMPNLVKTFEDYADARKVVTETNGAIYQLPAIEVSATTCQARVYFRTDVMDAAGLAVPASTEEFYEVLTALKAFNDGAAPLVTDIRSGSYFEPFMYASFGASRNPDFEDANGQVVFNRTADQYRLFLSYMNRLYKEGLLHEEYLTMDGTTKLSLVSEGLGVFTDTTAHSLTEADFPSGNVDLGVLTPLTSEYDDERLVLGASTAQNGGFLLNADSEYVVEICRLLDVFFATEEVVPGSGVYGMIGCYGPENGMWRFANEEKTLYEFVLPEGYEGSTTNYQYDEVIYGNVGRVDALAHAVTSTPGNAQARQLGFVNNLIPHQEDVPFPANYLKFTDDEQFVLDNNYVAIKSYVEQMRNQFITGVSDIEADWDAYCQTIEAMNMAEVLAVYQASFDRWNG